MTILVDKLFLVLPMLLISIRQFAAGLKARVGAWNNSSQGLKLGLTSS